MISKNNHYLWWKLGVLTWIGGCTIAPSSPSLTSPLVAVPTAQKQIIPVSKQRIAAAATSKSLSLSQASSSSLAQLRYTPIVPGGVAWIPLDNQDSGPPKIFYKQRRVMVLHDQGRWVALVGIPLDAKLGQHQVIDRKTGRSYTFEVTSKTYKSQYIELKQKAYVTPNKQDLHRIQQEAKLIKAALATPWRAVSTSPLPLAQPVHGRLSSSFGLQRYFNGQARRPHGGLDIVAPQGKAVKASASGIVINTGHYFFNGKTVFIDHGQSVVTMYCHLHDTIVTVGQTIRKGQVIGHVGKTGRATGPHVHWSVSMNNTMINPLLVAQQE
jgi:murein DD-endopeptidase MepM/ murein hydrolase activator NlpD